MKEGKRERERVCTQVGNRDLNPLNASFLVPTPLTNLLILYESGLHKK